MEEPLPVVTSALPVVKHTAQIEEEPLPVVTSALPVVKYTAGFWRKPEITMVVLSYGIFFILGDNSNLKRSSLSHCWKDLD
jgi:hypothetical protein